MGVLLTLVAAPTIALAYVVLLIVMGEIGKADLALVLSVVRPKAKPPA